MPVPPTRSERFALLFLSTLLLLGMGLSYAVQNHPPFSLKVLPASVEEEATFEASRQVSLTKGGEGDFTRLPGVGPERARRIVAFRERYGFKRKEDLLQVKGIGAKTYDAIKDFLILE